MAMIQKIFMEMVFFINEISIYLVLGLLVAGILYVVFPASLVKRHLGRNSFFSVIKSTLFGIPLPLCSCGVIPVANSLNKSGASKGATAAFLISTPQVGADSFMITYSLLGWVFALFRIVASLITAAVVGLWVNLLEPGQKDGPKDTVGNGLRPGGWGARLREMPAYVEYNLLGSIANSLVVGIIIAGAIAALVPQTFFEKYFSNTFLSMLLMMLVGIPLYVCASASTPIAASLIYKGISPGAALVFLLTGPATNAVTISAIVQSLGRKVAAVYLAGIAVVSLALGLVLNLLAAEFGFKAIIHMHHTETLPFWLKTGGTIVLMSMLGLYYIKVKLVGGLKHGKSAASVDSGGSITLGVRGMTCMHCADTVKKAAESVPGVSAVQVDLKAQRVRFRAAGAASTEKVREAVRQAGYGA
jgi:uncharacterized membrane protein YraQ (UPF0718 family)/copper chaperone CopZ